RTRVHRRATISQSTRHGTRQAPVTQAARLHYATIATRTSSRFWILWCEAPVRRQHPIRTPRSQCKATANPHRATQIAAAIAKRQRRRPPAPTEDSPRWYARVSLQQSRQARQRCDGVQAIALREFVARNA